MWKKIAATFASRKFLAALLGTLSAAAAAYSAHTPVSLELIEKVLAPLYVWAVVEGGLDALRILNPAAPAAPSDQLVNPLDGPHDKVTEKTTSGRNIIAPAPKA